MTTKLPVWAIAPCKSAFATDKGWELLYKGSSIVIKAVPDLKEKLETLGVEIAAKPIANFADTQFTPEIGTDREGNPALVITLEPEIKEIEVSILVADETVVDTEVETEVTVDEPVTEEVVQEQVTVTETDETAAKPVSKKKK